MPKAAVSDNLLLYQRTSSSHVAECTHHTPANTRPPIHRESTRERNAREQREWDNSSFSRLLQNDSLPRRPGRVLPSLSDCESWGRLRRGEGSAHLCRRVPNPEPFFSCLKHRRAADASIPSLISPNSLLVPSYGLWVCGLWVCGAGRFKTRRNIKRHNFFLLLFRSVSTSWRERASWREHWVLLTFRSR